MLFSLWILVSTAIRCDSLICSSNIPHDNLAMLHLNVFLLLAFLNSVICMSSLSTSNIPSHRNHPKANFETETFVHHDPRIHELHAGNRNGHGEKRKSNMVILSKFRDPELSRDITESDKVSHNRITTKDESDSQVTTNSFAAFELISKDMANGLLLKGENIRKRRNQNHINRLRRNIVLIDEDFDVPSAPDLKRSSSYKESTKSDEIKAESEITSEHPEDERYEETTADMTEDSLLPLSSFSTISKDSSVVVPSTLKTSASETLRRTSKSPEASSPMDQIVHEGSGDDDSVPPTDISTSESVKEAFDELCLNFTCDSKDLTISPSRGGTMPVGVNVTITCTISNVTEDEVLKLYKFNSSVSSLLHQSSKNRSRINFEIPLTEEQHSGRYLCVRLTEQSCCHKQLEVTVYTKPDYKRHLIIIAIVAAVSLFFCILFAICKRSKEKNYMAELEQQKLKKDTLL